MKHILFTLKECPSELLNDEGWIRDTVYMASKECNSTLLALNSHKFQPQGVTCVAMLAESHISIHTWPEEGKAAVDVYTCGDCNPKIGCDMIIHQLYAQDHTLSYIER